MDMKDLRSLVKMITDSDITEFELNQGDEKILIRRGQEKEIVTVAAPVAPAPVAAAPAPATAAPAPQVVSEAPPVVEGETINSPMVGTVYRKPSPDADPFVEVGATVEKGQTLCLVEAMKLFNEIEADFKCRIVEILKDDGQPVEFGEPLFRIERL